MIKTSCVYFETRSTCWTQNRCTWAAFCCSKVTPRVKAIGSHNSLWGRGQEQGLGWRPIVRVLHIPHPRTNELSAPPARAGVSSQLGRPVLPGGFQGRLKCECQMRRCSPQLHPWRGGRWPGRRDGDHSSLLLRGGHWEPHLPGPPGRGGPRSSSVVASGRRQAGKGWAEKYCYVGWVNNIC